MLWFIIDGYNVIKQHKRLKCLTLQTARQQLREITLGKITRDKATLVYDGKDLPLVNRQNSSSIIEELFSRGETADELIKKMIKKAKNPSQLVIITNDREIQRFAKSNRVKFEAVEIFLKRKPAGRQQPKALKPKDIQEINSEIVSVWQKKYNL